MGRSSLMGIEQAELEAEGRDNAALGPSDSSDSGSDMVGVDELAHGDPAEPVDVALGRDEARSLAPVDTLAGSSSDRAGSGERRSAGSDAGEEAADISVDRVFSIGSATDADEDDALDQAVYEDVLDDEVSLDDEEDEAVAAAELALIARVERDRVAETPEDESADPVGDGHADADLATRLAAAPKPAQPDLPEHPAKAPRLRTAKGSSR